MYPLYRRTAVAWIAAAFLAPTGAHAHEDHPLLSGMPDFRIRSKTVKDFDAVAVPARRVYQTAAAPYTGPATLEGKVTRLTYAYPRGRGKVEIYRNYASAIEKLGGQRLSAPVTADVSGWHVFRIERAGAAPVSVVLEVPYESEYRLTIVEHQAMVQSVQAGELARAIEGAGFATVYVNFDTNQAVLKDDGQAAVKEIAALLRQQPALRLSIEGHTDNVGQPADNLRLSQARAEAVMKAVVAQGIDASRLKAVGRGQEQPVADNRQEAGRAKNRRVELVKWG
jgi:OmpA-OmpF porin, OOP family